MTTPSVLRCPNCAAPLPHGAVLCRVAIDPASFGGRPAGREMLGMWRIADPARARLFPGPPVALRADVDGPS
ncbi:MAG: hypothetical protein WCJ30_01490 [Deltaproteobacteria bacterium]